MSAGTWAHTLEDALSSGQGVERPFRCHVHEDNNASASVNVLKGVWYCHGCGARGVADSKRAPKVEELQMMLEPEKVARHYPETWLDLHLKWEDEIYWDSRFPRWLSWNLQMGQDPFTGNPCYAVHTAGAVLAGVGMRNNSLEPGEKGPRYLYPPHWSSAMSVFGRISTMAGYPILCVVEGAADSAAVWELGVPALAIYGSGIHLPQIELIARHNPRLILLGFDMDDAGESGVERAFHQLGRMAELQRVRWSAKDPGELDPKARMADITRAVRRSSYVGSASTTLHSWAQRVEDMKARYQRFTEEEMP